MKNTKHKTSKPITITFKSGMKDVIREYRGHIIQSFDLSQLHDPETRGRAYSIYASRADYDTGVNQLNATFRIDYLNEAKAFIDDIINTAA
jgi:hypothetical protein